jgi:Ca-activated chloride channel family protein
MRKLSLLSVGVFTMILGSVGCAKTAPVAQAPAQGGAAAAEAKANADAVASDGPGEVGKEPADRNKRNGTWIGAAPEGDLLSTSTRETFLGVWVDVPEARPEARPPMEVVLVVDTSGSMAGSKIESARAAATTLVRSLKDGDIVALDAFSDDARTLVPPTRLDMHTRSEVLRQIAQLVPTGSTNMFSGLTLAETQIAGAPASHSLRRIVMISDGIANVGPSSPDILGSLAERGLRSRAQVTSFGVGIDYDERTLNALSMRSNGRLYHIAEPREMAGMLRNELALLDATSRSSPLPACRSWAQTASVPSSATAACASRSARSTQASTARRSFGCASPIPPRSTVTRARSRACAFASVMRPRAISSASRRSSRVLSSPRTRAPSRRR